MTTYLIRALSFFIKEIHDIRRQPRLMISLVGGPLLVLAVFGATFRSANPVVTAVLVWPEDGIPGVDQKQVEQIVGEQFELIAVLNHKDEAMSMLENGQVDVVQVIPEHLQDQVDSGGRAMLQVFTEAIDPTVESWVRSLSYGEMNYINQLLLTEETGRAQEHAEGKSRELDELQANLIEIRDEYSPEKEEHLLDEIHETRTLLIEVEATLPPLSDAGANLSPDLVRLHHDIKVLSDDLDELESALLDADLPNKVERLNAVIAEIDDLQGTMKVFISIPAETIVSPVQESYKNLRGNAYSLVVFYAPAVLALLIQHLAITLAALALVRERYMGAFEMFRVAPLKISQIILGKTLAYTLYVSLAGGALTLLLLLLKVPLPAYPIQFAALVALLALSSIGIGFLISVISTSDSQAIQLTMLVLLLSIFFTGFFLPVSGFIPPANIISNLLPMTHGIVGFQRMLLSGLSPGADVWLGLLLITVLSYALVMILLRRAYRKVID